MKYEENILKPDKFLASLDNGEEKFQYGKLKIFFGMISGVGKTYSMLQMAHTEKLKSHDIVIGYVETSNYKETSELVKGFEIIPYKNYEYKSTLVQEMDLDAIIARKPQTVLIDELAHTNAPGSRHVKRYQDIKEILENGINVYTTLNVQNLESRSDIVTPITNIIVNETLPDSIFENADEIEVVDIAPEALLQRLSEWKNNISEHSEEDNENIFNKGNLIALREMTLRIVADCSDKQLHEYMLNKKIRGPWKSSLHLLVAIDYRQYSAKLLRQAKNLSQSMDASIQALYVESSHKLTAKEQQQLDKNITLARQLDIKFRIITNYDIVKAIVDFAQKENITHIIVGKPRVRNILSVFQFSKFVNKLIQYSGNIDVYILGSDKADKGHFREKVSMPSFTSNIRHYLTITFFLFLISVACYIVKDIIGYQAVSFVLLFFISFLALFYSTGPILYAVILSAFTWEYVFIPPQFTLYIVNPLDILMLVMFFVIALLNGILTSRVRRQEMKTKIREARTDALYQLTKELSMASGIFEVTKIADKYIRQYFKLDCAIILKNDLDQLDNHVRYNPKIKFSEDELNVASWVFKHSVKAGKYTETLSTTNFTFYPLTGVRKNIGVIAIEHEKKFSQGEDQFWEAFLSQISGKYEREFLQNSAEKAYILNESDKLYKTLFNSMSHEFRIPVSAIMGSADTLISQRYSDETKIQLYTEIKTASIRLNRLIENLLNMSRLESGRISPSLDWFDIHDLANKVADNLKQELISFKLITEIPADMPLVYIDNGLIEQVLHNLVYNATQNAPSGTEIKMKFEYENGNFIIYVIDNGIGFPPSELLFVFNKFYRGKYAKTGGTGLGLSIVKGFVEAHQGTVIAENRQGGGAQFTIKIPVKISEIKQPEQ